MNSHGAQALRQVDRVEQLCDFVEHSAMKAAVAQVPRPLPSALNALGFDIALWVGFGTVGLWAALDAFAERVGISRTCPICRGNHCIFGRFSYVQSSDADSLKELEDLRHLYAHNFAGEADNVYFNRKQPRHALKSGVHVTLTCGASFGGGGTVQLDPSHLRHYAGVARRVLEQCP
jgi:hypothetical protein